MDINFLLRYLRACFLRASGALWLAKRRARRNGVAVATLHRVLEEQEFRESSSLPGTLVRKETFEQFVHWIARNFEVIDLRNGIPKWGIKPSRPRVAITFDDGWLDNYTLAEPIATRHRCPITIFVCPDIIGARFPFWPERVSYLLASAPESALRRLFPEVSHSTQSRLTERAIDRMKKMAPEERDELIRELETAAGCNGPTEQQEPLNRTMSWEQIQEISQRGTGIGSHTFSHQILTSISLDTVNEN